MLAADERGETNDWGHPSGVENARCEGCGCSVIARFGGIPSTLCVSCQEDERRLLDPRHNDGVVTETG